MAVDLSEFRRVKDERCVIGRLFDSLNPEDREKLEAALAEPDISHNAIVEWLQRREIKTTNTTVGTHRKRRCRCD